MGTLFQDNWRLNQPPNGNSLTYIFTDSRDWDTPSLYRENCGFSRDSLVILCDVAFIDTFLAQRDLDKEIVPYEGDRPITQPFDLRTASAATILQLRKYLLMWIIGHETGHAVLGHGSAHFTTDRLNDPVSPRSLSQELEVAADSYILAKVNGALDKDWGFYAFLLNVLQDEIRKRVCPDRSTLQYCPNIQVGAGLLYPTSVLGFSTGQSHPEYLIRLLSLINLGTDKYNFGLIGYEVKQMIEHGIKENGANGTRNKD